MALPEDGGAGGDGDHADGANETCMDAGLVREAERDQRHHAAGDIEHAGRDRHGAGARDGRSDGEVRLPESAQARELTSSSCASLIALYRHAATVLADNFTLGAAR